MFVVTNRKYEQLWEKLVNLVYRGGNEVSVNKMLISDPDCLLEDSPTLKSVVWVRDQTVLKLVKVCLHQNNMFAGVLLVF